MGSAAEIGSISSISAILAALTAVLGGTVIPAAGAASVAPGVLFLSTSIFFWHLFSIFRTNVRMTYIALGVLMAIPVSLLGFLRTFLRRARSRRRRPASRSRGLPHGAAAPAHR